MMRWSITATVATGLLLSQACWNLEQPTPPTQTRLVIHGVLNPRTEQSVLVYRSRNGVPRVAQGGVGDDEPVSGALVTLTKSDGTMLVGRENLFCACPGVYVVPTTDNDVAPGSTLRLQVQTPSGEEAFGTTTIPSAPRNWIAFATQTFARARDTLRLAWPRVDGARSYELTVSVTGFTSIRYRVFTDTALAIPGTAVTTDGDMIFLPNTRAHLTVVAVDESYYDYYRSQSDPFAGAPPSQLRGAVGVFGSVATILTLTLDVR